MPANFLRRLVPVVLLLPLFAGAQEQQKAASSPYVGSETCGGCHEDLAKAFNKNAHAVLLSGKFQKGENPGGCESCHGPGAKHAESGDPADIRNPRHLQVTAANDVCLACHRQQTGRTDFISSSHAKNQIACVACHSVHKGAEALRPRKIASINEMCAGCHSTQWAEMHRPYTHRVIENGMSCVDCHNPHGTPIAKPLSTSFGNDVACLKCHGDLRGPFVFEHAPVRLEGCTSCHMPHGSANPKMLIRADVRFVCLECHANLPASFTGKATGVLGGVPPAFHDLRSPQFRNCTVCHVAIHGSNVNRSFLR